MFSDRNTSIKNRIIVCATFSLLFTMLHWIGKKFEESESINKDNPYLNDGKNFTECECSIYEKSVKPFIDRALSFVALIILLPLFVIIAVIIYIEDPGPVFFTQTRVGKNKRFFSLHKFRSMRKSAPRNVPTHQLECPDQYITKVGKILRRTSLDELPQIWDIFRGRMSIIGPRPALWNQKDLIEERENYNANSVMPGLTGWAQINGRDELEILVKSALDGEYVNHLRKEELKPSFLILSAFWGL